MESRTDTERAHDRPDAAPRRWPIALELCAWIGAWIVARGMLVLSFADVFGYGEELQKACAGKAILDGLAVEHHELAYHYYEGGGFVASHLDALAFAWFGESLLAVKLVSLLLGTGVLAAGWSFCRAAGGLRAARIFALLFVLAPDSVQRNSLLNLGIHFHALMFVAWILAFTVKLAFVRDLRPRTWIGWGLSGGFGLFFSYQCALTIALSIGTLLLVLRRELLSPRTAWCLMGWAIGLAPLAWMFANVGWAVFDIHGVDLTDNSISKVEIVKQFFLSIFTDRGALDSAAVILGVLASGIVLAALARSAPVRERRSARLVVAHGVLFCAAYFGTSLAIAAIYHYILLQRLLPLWFLSVLGLALGAAVASASPKRWLRWIACACVVIPAIVGATDLARSVQEGASGSWAEHFRLLAHTKGYEFKGYLEKLSAHLTGSRADRVRVMLGFHEPSPQLLHEAIAIAMYGDAKTSLAEIEAELDALGIRDHRGFLLGLGPMLAKEMKDETLEERVQACAALPPNERDVLIEAIGRWGEGDPVTQDRVLREGNQSVKSDLPVAYFRGLGHRLYRASGVGGSRRYFQIRSSPWRLDREGVHAVLDKCPEPPASILRNGYEAALFEHTLVARP